MEKVNYPVAEVVAKNPLENNVHSCQHQEDKMEDFKQRTIKVLKIKTHL